MDFLLALFGNNVHGAMKNNAIPYTLIKSEKNSKFVRHIKKEFKSEEERKSIYIERENV